MRSPIIYAQDVHHAGIASCVQLYLRHLRTIAAVMRPIHVLASDGTIWRRAVGARQFGRFSTEEAAEIRSKVRTKDNTFSAYI